jgi:hypothetical protein
MTLTLSMLAAVVVLLALSRGWHAERATPEQVASARAIAGARLQQLADEREERFRLYHRAWSFGGGARRGPARGYVLEFTARAGSR